MRADARERCRRCGADPFAAGEPYTFWIWVESEGVTKEQALRLCAPCGRDFLSQSARAEYLRLGLFG